MRKVNLIMGIPVALVFSLILQPFDVEAQGTVAPGQSPSQLQKNVSKDEAAKLNDLAGKLRQIHHTVARLRKSAKELQQEFNRTDLRILEYDDYINQYIDDKPVAYDEQLYPYGFQNIGNTSVTGGKPLPPRKSYVDYSAGQIEDLTKILGQDASAALEDCSQERAEPRSAEEKASASQALSNVAKLTDRLVVLTKDTNYDKDQIVNCASGIVDSAGKLDSSLKALFKSLHSEFQKN